MEKGQKSIAIDLNSPELLQNTSPMGNAFLNSGDTVRPAIEVRDAKAHSQKDVNIEE